MARAEGLSDWEPPRPPVGFAACDAVGTRRVGWIPDTWNPDGGQARGLGWQPRSTEAVRRSPHLRRFAVQSATLLQPLRRVGRRSRPGRNGRTPPVARSRERGDADRVRMVTRPRFDPIPAE